MNENYIDFVRESLYIPSKSPKTTKKIVFSKDSYRSENIFREFKDAKSEKIKNRKSTPYKKTSKKKRNFSRSDESLDADIFSPQSTDFSELSLRSKKQSKRKKLRDCDTHSSENLSPSKSEIDVSFSFNFRQHCSNHVASSDSEESNVEFDLDSFFNTRDNSLNESLTEAHSGVDYELLSESVGNVTICSSRNLYTDEGIHEKVEILKPKKNRSGKKAKEDKIKKTKKEWNKFEIENFPVCDIDVTEQIRNSSNKDKIGLKRKSDKRRISASQNSLVDETNKPRKDQEQILIDNEFGSKTDVPFEPPTSPVSSQKKQKSYQHSLQDAELILKEKLMYYDVSENCKVLLMEEKSSLPFHGMFRLEVLRGMVEILGSVLQKSHGEQSVYSPRGSAFLRLENVSNFEEETTLGTLHHYLREQEDFKNTVVCGKTAVIFCKTFYDPRICLLEKYIPQQIFPKLFDNGPRLSFDPTENRSVLSANDSWDPLINMVGLSTRLLIAGGKGVGKSTFLRYAINRLLMRHKEIRVIDLDPGQSEFSVPGSISVLDITEPVLGPNYTHLRKPERSYICDINVGHRPSAYISLISTLMTDVRSFKQIPTLINCMGFVKGIGVKILSSALTYILPSDVVQIISTNHQKNFSNDLTMKTVKQNCDLFKGNPSGLNFTLHTISSMSDCNNGWALGPRQSREMCVLAYFGEMMANVGVNSLTSHLLPMFEIPLGSVHITDLQGNKIPFAAVNANLVALCSRSTGASDNFICSGYGIVRGVDLERKKLVLMTPESLAVLQETSHLVLGSVSLPPSVYMSSDDIKGSVPYVMEGELTSLGQITKRSYLPINKK